MLLVTLVLAPGLTHAAVSNGRTPVSQEGVPPEEEQTGEIRFSADDMQHDRGLDIVTARGNVQVQHQDRILRADVIVYNRKQEFVTASGNVTLLEPTGEVIFAEFMELSGDLRDGVIADLRAILKDGSLIAASGGRRTNANILDLRNAVYSPCRLCDDDPSRAPLWQVKAVKVIHDKARQTIEYRDAWLEVAGIPVLYTPYLSHPDPTVKRKSGFLTPAFGSSTVTGSFLTTPYFFNIAANADTTLSPTFTADESVIMAGEYRHKFTEGDFEARGSIKDNTSSSELTYSTENGVSGIRGHIAAKGRFDYDETWRWGFDVNRQSDQAYISRFGFAADNTLPETTNALATQGFVEGFRDRNYIQASGTIFQTTLTNQEDSSVPLILPLVDFNHVSEPDRYGGYSTLDVNALALTRTTGSDTRRLSVRSGWNLPYVAPAGDVYTLSTKMSGDFYNTSNLEVSGQNKTSNYAYRLVPQVALDWRYPFVSGDSAVYQMFEPIASVVVSPYGGNSSNIPNEDSQNLEFDDTNLFSDNRFTGLDRVEGGPRINYGFKWGVFGKGGGSTSMLLGQSYRYRTDDSFAAGSGLEDNFSDIVGRVHVSPSSMLDVYFRTRINKTNLEARRNEINLGAGIQALRLNTNYVYFDHQEGSEFAGREEISGSLSSQFTKTWRSSISATRDLAENDLRTMALNLTYEDECLLFSTALNRTFFQNQELHPEDSIIFRIMFKTLGEVTQGVTALNPNQAN
ncbi:MAG: LPS-assembly protein LptD [Rhodospirillales bacterium]|nr:LPS-assembly protein LptD [Rhodospirillales bacterium]